MSAYVGTPHGVLLTAVAVELGRQRTVGATLAGKLVEEEERNSHLNARGHEI